MAEFDAQGLCEAEFGGEWRSLESLNSVARGRLWRRGFVLESLLLPRYDRGQACRLQARMALFSTRFRSVIDGSSLSERCVRTGCNERWMRQVGGRRHDAIQKSFKGGPAHRFESLHDWRSK
jgi:hypothetical protein